MERVARGCVAQVRTTIFRGKDEMEIDLVPVLLGRGIRLFEYLGVEPIKLERTVAVLAPDVTHLRFRVKREREE